MDKWEKEFRRAASADGFAIFRDHLRRLDLPDRPDLMLDGTIHLVRLCYCYSSLDKRSKSFNEFLGMQTYDPSEADGANYTYTFDIHRQAYARVFVKTKDGTLDLADIYGSPWQEYQVCGFDTLWISHPDWSRISEEEAIEIEREVSDDILYDYAKDELNFWCDKLLDETYVLVNIQDA
ncbi:MAG: hypothetical protein K9N23_16515 [Akkermansiaceae bacterium]|nr:hypothetical protein [Akkermansiaceae bacterium]